MSGSDERELPEGWVSAPLKHLGDWFGGGTPSKSNTTFWRHGTLPWVSPKDMKRFIIDSAEDSITEEAVAKSSTKLVPPGSVLMVVRSGILAHTFPVAVAGVPLTLNQDMKAVRPRHVAPLFLAHGLRAYTRRILETCTKQGTTVASVNTEALHEIEFPIPPLNEQKRIVAKIDALTEKSREAREALEEVPVLLDKLRQSILAAAFRGDLTKEWRAKNPDVEPASVLLERIRQERRKKWEEAQLAKFQAKGKLPQDDSWKKKYVEPQPVDTTDLPDLPEGWCWAILEDLCEPDRGIPYGIVQTGEPYPNGIPTVRCGDIKNFSIDIGNLKRIDPKIALDYGRTRLKGTEVLLAIRGTVGASAKALPQMAGMNISREVAMIPPLSGINQDFLVYLLAAPDIQAAIGARVKGVAQSGINLVDLRSLPVPIPPAQEQDQIAVRIQDILHLADQLKGVHDLAFSAFNHLDSAILAKAFRGELVPQDPNDEPASVLLERIAAERVTAESNGKKPRSRRAK